MGKNINTFLCPHCGNQISIEPATKKETICADAPSAQELAQAKYIRDAKMGTPIAEKLVGVVLPQQNISGNDIMFGVFIGLAVLLLVYAFTKRDWLGRPKNH